MMQAETVDAAADYVRRGRAFRGLTDADLAGAWVAAFKAYSHNPAAAPFRLAFKDLGAEHDLRQIDPPFDLVREDLERFRAAAQQVFEQLIADPGHLQEVERDLQVDLSSFRARRDRPSG